MLRYAILVLCFCLLPVSSFAFGGAGCGAGECSDCHSLTNDEAFKLLPPGADGVNSVEFSEVGGLWEVKGQAREQMFTVYIDYSKQYLIAGNILRISDGVDISRNVDVEELNPEGAFLVGDGNAPVQVYIFTDPKCGHCRKLHHELYKVVEQLPQVAFRVKLMALMTDIKTINSIVCSGSIQVLEDAMASKPVAELSCDSHVTAATMAFAKRWNIRSTPTLILPDGKVLSGGRPATALIEELTPYVEAVKAK
jgi:thiol:disulfide interchange protein DsbC